jgi:hypothetical protein
MALETIIDLVLAVLLVAAIGSSYLLHRRIDVFRKGQQELAGLVEQLNQATNQAQASVAEMKSSGLVAEEQLKSQIGKARALADELSLITEAGDNLADRIERRLVGSAGASAGAGTVSSGQKGAEKAEGEGAADEDVDRPAYFSALKEAR